MYQENRRFVGIAYYEEVNVVTAFLTRVLRRKAALRFLRSWINKLVLFLYWKDLVSSTDLQDSGKMESMQRCIVSGSVALILVLVNQSLRKSWVSDYLPLYSCVFSKETIKRLILENCPVALYKGYAMSTQCTTRSEDLHFQHAREMCNARFQTLQNSRCCSFTGRKRDAKRYQTLIIMVALKAEDSLIAVEACLISHLDTDGESNTSTIRYWLVSGIWTYNLNSLPALIYSQCCDGDVGMLRGENCNQRCDWQHLHVISGMLSQPLFRKNTNVHEERFQGNHISHEAYEFTILSIGRNKCFHYEMQEPQSRVSRCIDFE